MSSALADDSLLAKSAAKPGNWRAAHPFSRSSQFRNSCTLASGMILYQLMMCRHNIIFSVYSLKASAHLTLIAPDVPSVSLLLLLYIRSVFIQLLRTHCSVLLFSSTQGKYWNEIAEEPMSDRSAKVFMSHDFLCIHWENGFYSTSWKIMTFSQISIILWFFHFLQTVNVFVQGGRGCCHTGVAQDIVEAKRGSFFLLNKLYLFPYFIAMPFRQWFSIFNELKYSVVLVVFVSINPAFFFYIILFYPHLQIFKNMFYDCSENYQDLPVHILWSKALVNMAFFTSNIKHQKLAFQFYM